MRMNFSRIDRTPAFAGVLCLVAACLTGCASKNPLIDEPAVASKAPEQQVQNAETKSADETAGMTTGAPTGVRRFLGIFTPYRVDIQQGNFISREMVTQLKENMQRNEAITREQVRFALGTPLLTDAFHADRWDYIFRLKKRSGEIISNRVTVFFKDNRLVRIEGGMLPTEQEYLALIAGSAPGAAVQGK